MSLQKPFSGIFLCHIYDLFLGIFLFRIKNLFLGNILCRVEDFFLGIFLFCVGGHMLAIVYRVGFPFVFLVFIFIFIFVVSSIETFKTRSSPFFLLGINFLGLFEADSRSLILTFKVASQSRVVLGLSSGNESKIIFLRISEIESGSKTVLSKDGSRSGLGRVRALLSSTGFANESLFLFVRSGGRV